MGTHDWLNYHHLLYFQATAHEGSMTRAARKLRLAQPTLSAQIRQLEDALGEPLFDRKGGRLVLTAAGRTALQYADAIFGLGAEMQQALRSRDGGRRTRLTVGVADGLPKLVVYQLLEPVLELEGGARLDVRDGPIPDLLAQLGAHQVDLVIADAALPPGSGIRAYNHALGESGVTLFARPELAAVLRCDFPRSLAGAPMLLPAAGSALRRGLDEWLDRLEIAPDIVAEVADSALMKVFGQNFTGAFAAPSAVADEVIRQYRVEAVGVAEDVKERFWAISAERRVRHPAVEAIVARARRLFGTAG